MYRFLLPLLLSTLALLAFPASAQIHGGLKGGLNLSTLDGSINRRSDVRTSGHGGLYLTAWLGEHLAIQPEVLYSAQGMKFGLTPTGATDNTLRIPVLSIPLLLKVYPGNKHFYLEVGPQFGVLLGATEERTSQRIAGGVTISNASTADVKAKFKSSDFAAAVGVGVEVRRLQFGVRGIYGLSDLNNDPSEAAFRAAANIGGLHHRVLQASVGFRLF